MISINESYEAREDDIQEVIDWCDETYDTNFAPYFEDVYSLRKELDSKSHPITDESLERILTYVPIQLFSVSEMLSKFTLSLEVLKLKMKETEHEVAKNSTASTATKRQEEAAISILGDKLLITAYQSILTRVEKEMSYTRELIMGAKKVWDARRRTDGSMPVGEIDSSDYDYRPPAGNMGTPLPDYGSTTSGKYIK